MNASNHPFTPVKLFLAPLLAIALVFTGCGGDKKTGDGKTGDGKTSSNLSMSLHFPEGYNYNQSTSELTAPGDGVVRAMPSYVTRITLTISGQGIDAVTYEVPLNTLAVTVYLPKGIYTFTLTVYTNIGLTFTGETVAELGSPTGGSPNIVFDLDVNSAPKIDSMTADRERFVAGGSTGISVNASDLDTDDVLTYRWSGGGGSISGSGNSVTFSASSAGVYSVGVTVTDGHGGEANASVSITVEAPVSTDKPVINSLILYSYAPAVGRKDEVENSGRPIVSGTWKTISVLDTGSTYCSNVTNGTTMSIGGSNTDTKLQFVCNATDSGGGELRYSYTATWLKATLSSGYVTSASAISVDTADTSKISATNSFTGSSPYDWNISGYSSVTSTTYNNIELMDLTCEVTNYYGVKTSTTKRFLVYGSSCM